jgi:superfamily II DNA/RNA helicase
VGQIHGDMEQADRIRELDRFKAGTISILCASDVAARGLDIPGVSHVFNYDVPWHPDDYVHRIGRTGRAGRTGIAVSLATSEDAEHLAEIEKLTRQAIPRWGKTAAPALKAAPAETADVESEAAPEPGQSADARRKRRRKGRGKGDAEKTEGAAAAAPRAAEAPAAPRAASPKPAAAAAPAAPTPRHPPRPTARDPLASYRQVSAPARRHGRDDDDGERFIGFGPEGIPAFLMQTARPPEPA